MFRNVNGLFLLLVTVKVFIQILLSQRVSGSSLMSTDFDGLTGQNFFLLKKRQFGNRTFFSLT